MFEGRAFGAMTLVAALMSGTASMALTTDEVWADWQSVMAGDGMTVTAATEVKDGDDLRLNGVTIASTDGMKVTMAEVMLTAEDDGSVAIVPMDIAVTVKDGAKVGVTQAGLTVFVHEDEGGRGYGVMADKLEVSFDSGSTEEGGQYTGKVAFDALDGRYERAANAALVNVTADTMSYDVTQKDQSMSLDQTQKASLKDMEVSSELTLPDGIDLTKIETPEAFGAAVKAGLAFVGEFKQGSSESVIEERSPSFPFAATITSTGGSTGVDLGVNGISIGGHADGIAVVVPPGALPTEVTGAIDAMTFKFAMPVMATEEAGDYTYQVALKNVVIADEGWALFDPTGALPRSPANLEIDAGGKLKIDLLDLMMSSESGQPPKMMPELLTLDLRALGLKLAGAAFSGTGAFTFDNSMVAAGGPPMPIGTASVKLEGGNKLIDGLVAMGVISGDDANGARLMMGMFGRPAGDDVLTSEIEAKEGGSIFVNGQQVQ